MKEIKLDGWNRLNTYEWFKNFSNSTYSMNVRMDVTKLVKYTKDNNQSFFINFLFIVLKAMDNVKEMRMRLVDGKPVIFDNINPGITVMTKAGTYTNLRYENKKEYKEFYKISRESIDRVKNQTEIIDESYNPKDCYNEYYITCVPWVDITGLTHPIPDSLESQCIPRVCWGRYSEVNGKYELTLNITVSHIFVDGYPLSCVFNNVQEYLNNILDVLK